jgi:hypothetical protein
MCEHGRQQANILVAGLPTYNTLRHRVMNANYSVYAFENRGASGRMKRVACRPVGFGETTEIGLGSGSRHHLWEGNLMRTSRL